MTANIVDIAEDLPENIKMLLRQINDYIGFNESDEEVGEELSPDIEKYSLIIEIDKRIKRTLEELANQKDHRLIQPLVSMLYHYPDNPKKRWVYWPNYTSCDGFISDKESSPLWKEIGKLVANTIEKIIKNSDLSSEDLLNLYPDLVKHRFLD
jgi:hypothetical protein